MLECAHAVAKEIDPGLVKNYQIVEEIDQAIRLRAETFEVAGRTYYLANYAAAIDASLAHRLRSDACERRRLRGLSNHPDLWRWRRGVPQLLGPSCSSSLERRIKMDVLARSFRM